MIDPSAAPPAWLAHHEDAMTHDVIANIDLWLAAQAPLPPGAYDSTADLLRACRDALVAACPPPSEGLTVVYVHGHNGKPVAAPCCLSGCQYGEALDDALYHADCCPNRRQAEAAIADAKEMNDRWADEVKARRDAEDALQACPPPSAAATAWLEKTLALIVQFERSRDDCWEQVYRKRLGHNETTARECAARAEVWDLAARCVLNLVAACPPTSAAPATLLTIAGLVNGYHNDGTTRTAAETLRAIADALGKPMEPQAPPGGE